MSVIYTAGYPSVCLGTCDGKRKVFYIHRLVAAMFLPNQSNKPIVHHKDCDKTNSNVSNLEWVTYEEHSTLPKTSTNVPWAIKIPGKWGDSNTCGTKNGMNKYPESMIVDICKNLSKGLTHRQCAILAGLPDNENSRLFVTSIATKKRWRCISDKYFQS